MLDDAPQTLVLDKEQDTRKLLWMYAVSALGHLLFFILMMVVPTSLPSSYRLAPRAISVDLVSLPAGEPAPAPPAPAAAPEPVAAPEPPAPEAVPVPAPQPQPEPEPISVAPKPAPEKVVKSLKKKTLNKEAVANSEVQQPKPPKAVPRPSPPQPPARERQLSRVLESMRQKVASQEKSRATAATGSGSGGGGGGGGAAVLSRIQNYRLEAAIAVSQNWAFSQQLAGADGELETRLTFRILPNGEITDIEIVQPSGNRYLDESAFRAVQKASPVAPHPEGLNQPYIEVGVKATPSGFR